MPDWRNTGAIPAARRELGGTEARDVACFGDELGGQHGPHSGQAADEGPIEGGFAKRSTPRRARTGQLGRQGPRLASSRIKRAAMCSAGTAMVCSAAAARAGIGEVVDLRHAAGAAGGATELVAGLAQLGRGHGLGQRVERPLGCEIEAARSKPGKTPTSRSRTRHPR